MSQISMAKALRDLYDNDKELDKLSYDFEKNKEKIYELIEYRRTLIANLKEAMRITRYDPRYR